MGGGMSSPSDQDVPLVPHWCSISSSDISRMCGGGRQGGGHRVRVGDARRELLDRHERLEAIVDRSEDVRLLIRGLLLLGERHLRARRQQLRALVEQRALLNLFLLPASAAGRRSLAAAAPLRLHLGGESLELPLLFRFRWDDDIVAAVDEGRALPRAVAAVRFSCTSAWKPRAR